MPPNNTATPNLDASMGLIMRMNHLWFKVNTPAANGKYDQWNNDLDRIFVNLDYAVDYEVKEDEDGNIIDVVMDGKPKKIFDFLSLKIANIKGAIRKIDPKLKHKEYAAARGKWYNALLKKERWLRKFMMEKKLYLKEVSFSPDSSMWGS